MQTQPSPCAEVQLLLLQLMLTYTGCCSNVYHSLVSYHFVTMQVQADPALHVVCHCNLAKPGMFLQRPQAPLPCQKGG